MPQDKTKPSLLDAQSIRHLLTAGGLVAGTLGTLLLGAALQVDPETVASESPAVITGTARPGVPPQAGGSVAAPEPPAARPELAGTPPRALEPTPSLASPPAAALSLLDRDNDARRMLNSGDAWTLQFMVTCNDDSATRLLQSVNADQRLFVLPISLNDQDCYRICWNTFRSRDRALASRDIPDALRKINPEPIARKVADVTP